MAEYDEKTQQATPRRKQQAREKGQVARSQDLTAIAATGGVIMAIYFGGSYFFSGLFNMTRDFLSFRHGAEPLHVSKMALVQTLQILAPMLLAAVVMATVTSVAQGGLVYKPFSIDMERFNPVGGLKRIFSFNGLKELLKGMLKFAIGGWIFYYIIKKNLGLLPSLAAMDMNQLISVSGRLILNVLTTAFLCFLVVAFTSYLLERWQFERSLKMSREEIKEEFKETEGDPMIKSRIKSLQREAARKRMMQEVPKATVVITNPTHLAVALKYEDGKMLAPKITAKGAGFVAEKIREIARDNRVPVLEDKPLARALFKHDLNAFVPEELYAAVAKIIAYVYKLKGTA